MAEPRKPRSSTINSMTGFGRAVISEGEDHISVELNSVNSRYLKVSLRLSDVLYPFEKDIHDFVKKRVRRGSVNAYITYKTSRPEMSYAVNSIAVKGYLKQVRALKKNTGLEGDLHLDTLLSLPGVVFGMPRDGAGNKRVWHLTRKALEEALEGMKAMRAREGASLRTDLFARVRNLKGMLARVRKYVPSVVEAYRKKLHARLKTMLNGTSVALDEATVVREVAVFADRSDISEEISRLGGHLEHFMTAGRKKNHPGRKLDFITQEMLRETNTLGAKANSAQLTGLVVQMKSEIDKIKEQLQNVE